MGYSDRNAGEEGPLFALEPVVVADVVGVREERVEGQERDGVEIRVPRQRLVQRRCRDFGRLDSDGCPAIRLVSTEEINEYGERTDMSFDLSIGQVQPQTLRRIIFAAR